MNIAIKNRLRRISGQLEKLEKTIDSGMACSDVIPQFLAVKGAFNAAFEAYVKESLNDCPDTDIKSRDQLISMLIKK